MSFADGNESAILHFEVVHHNSLYNHALCLYDHVCVFLPFPMSVAYSLHYNISIVADAGEQLHT